MSKRSPYYRASYGKAGISDIETTSGVQYIGLPILPRVETIKHLCIPLAPQDAGEVVSDINNELFSARYNQGEAHPLASPLLAALVAVHGKGTRLVETNDPERLTTLFTDATPPSHLIETLTIYPDGSPEEVSYYARFRQREWTPIPAGAIADARRLIARGQARVEWIEAHKSAYKDFEKRYQPWEDKQLLESILVDLVKAFKENHAVAGTSFAASASDLISNSVSTTLSNHRDDAWKAYKAARVPAEREV